MIVGGQTRACFNYHRLSSTIIDYHQLSSTIIDYHQLSSTIINYHQLSSIIINYHQLSSTIIDYHAPFDRGLIDFLNYTAVHHTVVTWTKSLITLWQLLTSFRQPADGFRFNWPIMMRQLWEAELTSSMLAFRQLSTPPLTVTCILIGHLLRKPSESCQKDVKKLSQTNQKL